MADQFLDFWDFFLDNTALYLKKYHKKDLHLCLIAHSFTKLSQNAWMHDMLDVIASYGIPLTFIEFLGVFIHYIDRHSYLKYYIFTKLFQIVCLTDVHILVFGMPNVTKGYWRLYIRLYIDYLLHSILTCSVISQFIGIKNYKRSTVVLHITMVLYHYQTCHFKI